MNVCVVFGTRPEAIKLAPVIAALRDCPGVRVTTCATGQHREMVQQVTEFFRLEVTHDFDVMVVNQTLPELSARLLERCTRLFARERFDWVVVQGDTTTSFIAALAAFYHGIPVAHVEAGLRTADPRNPFPEEMNRRLTGRLANVHFAPTQDAAENLRRESIAETAIVTTGNTVADALRIARRHLGEPDVEAAARRGMPDLDQNRRMILVTSHRRESFGEPLRNACQALRELAQNEQVELVFPVHLNPNVRREVHDILGGVPNVHLLEPVGYPTLVWLLSRAYFIITDSGGIQEEAASLGVPVLVTRENTERMESVNAGLSRLVGTDRAAILQAARALLHEPSVHAHMSRAIDLYGDGHAAERIAKYLVEH